MTTINRGPFNALVDDDGSGTTGTVWNKNQIKAVILDPADAAWQTAAQTNAANAFTQSQTITGSMTASTDYYEKGRTTPMGHWIDVPYSASNFTPNTGTWTVQAGDVVYLRYSLIGKTAIIAFNLTGTSISGNPSYLYVTLTGMPAQTGINMQSVGYYTEGGVNAPLTILGQGGAILALLKQNGATFAAATDTTNLIGQISVALA